MRPADTARALAALDRLPPFSPLLTHLLGSLADEDVSFSSLAKVIEKDTVLAGNVLRLVNSALYGCRSTVSSVPHAVSILGINKLRNFALGLSVARMWAQVRTPPGWSMVRFNLHSVATGMLADLLGQEVESEYPEGAFVAGLLHDLGRLLIAIALPSEHWEISRLFEAGGGSWVECERAVIGTTHAELSGLALERWQLPEPICRAAARHHRVPDLSASPLPLGAIVHEANLLALSLGHSIFEAEQPVAAPADWPARVIEQFQPGFDSVRAML